VKTRHYIIHYFSLVLIGYTKIITTLKMMHICIYIVQKVNNSDLVRHY